MSQDRTEKPTPKRLEKAREEGQIARSRDLAVAAATVAATIAMAMLGARLMRGLSERLAHDLARFGDKPLDTVTPGDLQALVITGAMVLAMLAGPIAVATMIAGAGMHGFQGGWSFAPGALNLKWTRLNPANGIKKFGLTQSGIETLKTLVTVSVIAWLGWHATHALLRESIEFAWLRPVDAAARGWHYAEGLLWKVAWGLAALALADFGVQKYRHTKSLKMTKQEVRDEAKQGEVSAEVKGRVRRIQREMMRRRMMRDVESATVVVTNPTHYAVALRYDRATMAAPQVVAMGQDHLALKIRERARQHGVPLVENRSLARALYSTAEVGETIPAPLFNAVAEVLAYLVRIKQLML